MISDDNPLRPGGGAGFPSPGSPLKQRVRRVYNGGLSGLARIHLPATLAIADAVGRLANRAHLHGPSDADVAAVFGWLPDRQRRDVARRISALRIKNHVAVAIVASAGPDPLAKLVRWPSNPPGHELFDGRGGVIIVACHVGAFLGIRAALHSINKPALMLRDLPMHDPASRPGALKRAVDCLRDGGVVVTTLDGPGGTSTRDVECLGRRIVLRRGPFVLARLTGAPLVPVVCAWTSRREIAVRIAPPIPRPSAADLGADAFETEMAGQAARWLDGYLRAEPQEIWPSTLGHYLGAPRT